MFKKNIYFKLFLCLAFAILLSPVTAFSLDSTPEKPVYICTLDLTNNYCDCDHPIDLIWVDYREDRAVMKIDMYNIWGEENAELKMEVEFETPDGWVMDLGNSDTNNGWGGDGATFSCDSEFDIRANIGDNHLNILSVYPNDFGGKINSPLSRVEFPYSFLVYKKAEFIVKDRHMSVKSLSFLPLNLQVNSEYLFRLNHIDKEGEPDWIYWLGVNRVVYPIGGPSYRNGSGIQKIFFTLSASP